MIFLQNILRAPVRSVMTTLGIAGGVALFVAVIAITNDLREQIAEAIGAYNLEMVVYERRATSPFSSTISRDQMETLMDRFDGAISPLVVGTLNEQWNAYAMVVGAPPQFVRRIPLVAGTSYADGQQEVMMGEIAAQRLGKQVGESIPLDGRTYTITGIFRTGSRLFDGGVMGDISEVQRMLSRGGEPGKYTMALLQTTDTATRERFIREISQSFPKLRAIPGTEFAGSLRLLRVVNAFVTTISVVVVLGTALIVTNTLLMAVAERTREIGILMTVGWTPWRVLRMLLAESLALCILGAAAGNLGGLLLLHVLNRMESVGFGWIPVKLNLHIVGSALGVTLFVAVLALVWPAYILWRIQPLSALRHE
ncbi:MAG: ABC transporter permease [Burkholderiaceae bacterium]|nr:ABC transporter permease [Burkholderiaceae bacterium]